LWGMMAHW